MIAIHACYSLVRACGSSRHGLPSRGPSPWSPEASLIPGPLTRSDGGRWSVWLARLSGLSASLSAAGRGNNPRPRYTSGSMDPGGDLGYGQKLPVPNETECWLLLPSKSAISTQISFNFLGTADRAGGCERSWRRSSYPKAGHLGGGQGVIRGLVW